MTSETPESSSATESPSPPTMVKNAVTTIVMMQQSALNDKNAATDPVSKMYFEGLGNGYTRIAMILLPLLGVKHGD